jgi:hypothetical protein
MISMEELDKISFGNDVIHELQQLYIHLDFLAKEATKKEYAFIAACILLSRDRIERSVNQLLTKQYGKKDWKDDALKFYLHTNKSDL